MARSDQRLVHRRRQVLLPALLMLLSCCSRGPAGAPDAPPSPTVPQPPAGLRMPPPGELMIGQIAGRMSVADLAGQMLMISMEHGVHGPVTRLGDAERDTLRRIRPGAVLLFGANMESVSQVRALVADLQAGAAVPLIVATDHEGGLVSRLTTGEQMHATVMPSATLVGIAARTRAAAGDREGGVSLAERWGVVTGSELRALGITVNMAPVADLDPPGGGGYLGEQRRTFGSDPRLVSDLVVALLLGMRSAGVVGVVKHFPGHGAARSDPHDGLVALDSTGEELRSRDLLPFVAAVASGAQAIMSAHTAYPRVTGDLAPATLSRPILTGILRQEMGFDGVVVTDSLNMDAVAGALSPQELALAAVAAGADVLLQPVDPAAVHAALVDAVDSGQVARQRLEQSVRRILLLKLRAGLFNPGGTGANPDAEIIGSGEHAAFAAEVRRIARGGQ